MAQYTALIKFNDPWWIGWVEEIPGVNAQASTRAELMADLHAALAEAIEMNRAEALAAAESGYEEEVVTL